MIPPQTTLSGENYRTLAGECSLPAYEQGQGKAYLEAGLNELQLDSLPKVTILCLDSPGAKAIVNNLLENWNSALGYYLNLNAVSENELQSALRNGNYQLALCPLRADNDGPWELFKSFFPRRTLIIPPVTKTRITITFLSQIKASPGEDGAALCLQAENHLIQNLVFYPLVYEKRYFASAQNVTGIISIPITVESTSLVLRKPRRKHDPPAPGSYRPVSAHPLLRRQMSLLRFLFPACRQPDDGRLLRPFDFRAFSLG